MIRVQRYKSVSYFGRLRNNVTLREMGMGSVGIVKRGWIFLSQMVELMFYITSMYLSSIFCSKQVNFYKWFCNVGGRWEAAVSSVGDAPCEKPFSRVRGEARRARLVRHSEHDRPPYSTPTSIPPCKYTWNSARDTGTDAVGRTLLAFTFHSQKRSKLIVW